MAYHNLICARKGQDKHQRAARNTRAYLKWLSNLPPPTPVWTPVALRTRSATRFSGGYGWGQSDWAPVAGAGWGSPAWGEDTHISE
ncbi:hypothetical protein C8J57DRAFT_1506097 [Mycena rebaudengoi]|nr:hypothetical protein C8J57DRAFT_1506097 [Mycena rebaudengoi]